MTHLYLNLFNGIGLARDEEGCDFATIEAAREQALLGVRSILSEELRRTGIIDLGGRVEIVDGQGSLLLTIAFCEAIEVKQGSI
ncbi:DUF6894 family protein [Sphingomonas sp. M1-B02]|uniref:DUF6894 family protein n=1 Tax=Sphingomonas sp. M1-B02 TaxID=3114300 RepID=UPI00223F2947|nr:hypothetical protein [Sphingomonas sp. S6-11]UZK66432.1 hypothetical protein OKW87_00905 [Sphingomonas sp. S6-11]